MSAPAPGLAACVVCGSGAWRAVWSVDRAPLHPLRPTDGDGGFGRLHIVECTACGHCWNAAFEPALLDDLYGAFVLTNQPVSEAMLKAVESTAALVMRHARARPAVLEIGGGHGALSLALAGSASEVHLVEPSRALSPDRFAGTKVTLHRAMFPAPSLGARRFDVVACRQVIEHVPQPAPFLAALRASLADDGVAYLELPRAEYIRQSLSAVDFHYPHVHYYGRAGIEALLARAGLAPVEVVEVKGGHDVGFVLRAAAPAPANVPAARGDWHGSLAARREHGRRRLEETVGAVALYGANAYAQALLGLYADFARFAAMFDDTETYRGRHAYGPGIELAVEPPTPERLASIGVVVITAYLHDRDIARRLRALGFAGPVHTVRSDASAGSGEVPPSLFRD